MERYDAVVIGGGAAGLAAGTWLGRYRCRTLVVDAGEHRNRWAEQVHGYLGADPCSPRWLLQQAKQHLGAYERVSLRDGSVGAVRRDGDGFVSSVDGVDVASRAIVICTGVTDAFPEVDDFMRYYGRSVFHCTSCDAFEARGEDVVALGWAPHVTGFALSLLNWARSVTIVTDGARFEGDDGDRARLDAAGIDVIERTATSLIGDGEVLRAMRLDDGREIACAAAFFSIAHRARSDIATALGCELDEEGLVVVDRDGRTSVPMVYAAGDVTPGYQLVQLAAAKGVAAGVTCALDLRVSPITEPGTTGTGPHGRSAVGS